MLCKVNNSQLECLMQAYSHLASNHNYALKLKPAFVNKLGSQKPVGKLLAKLQCNQSER